MKESINNSPLIDAVLNNCDVSPDIKEECRAILTKAMHSCEILMKTYDKDPRRHTLGPIPFFLLSIANLLNLIALSPENRESESIKVMMSGNHYLISEFLTHICKKGIQEVDMTGVEVRIEDGSQQSEE